MKKKLSVALIAFGILWILYAIFGRYLVLPGYLESLENGTAGGISVPSDVSGWKIARYLLWAYAFKLGIYFVILGAVIRTTFTRTMLAIYTIGGLLYIGVAYIPMPAPAWLFGVGGGIMTVVMILLTLHLTGMRNRATTPSTLGLDLRLFGYFFFAMATYNLCPLLGVKCFALSPEKMIRYGLQAEAASFAAHILIEMALGWCLILASYWRDRKPQAITV